MQQTQIAQHHITKTTGKTTLRGKVLEYTLENMQPYQADWSSAACACGSGGGCSGGYHKTM